MLISFLFSLRQLFLEVGQILYVVDLAELESVHEVPSCFLKAVARGVSYREGPKGPSRSRFLGQFYDIRGESPNKNVIRSHVCASKRLFST